MNRRPILHLRGIHAKLERQLAAERARTNPDGVQLARLKKLKLAIKDRLARHQPLPA
jgi:uncharacterized protein